MKYDETLILTKENIWKKNLYSMWISQILVSVGFGLGVPFIPYYLEELGMAPGDKLNLFVGLATSMPQLGMAIASPLWGKLSDRYGRKKLLIRAIVCCAITLFGLGLSRSITMFMIWRVLQGFFTGSIPAAMALISANTPEKNMTQALGLMTSSTFLGFAIGPVIGGIVCEFTSYSTCFIVGGFIAIVGLILVISFTKELPGTYGKELVEQKKKQKTGKKDAGIWSKPVVLILLMVLFMRIARTVFQPFAPIYVRDLIGRMQGANAYVGILNGLTCFTTAVATVTIARLGDRFNKIRFAQGLTIIAFIVSSALVLRLPIILFMAAYGCFFFVLGGIEPVLTSAAYEIVDESSLGAFFGVLNTVNSIGQMVSPLIGSAVSIAYGVHAITVVMPLFIFFEAFVTGIMIIYMHNREKAER